MKAVKTEEKRGKLRRTVTVVLTVLMIALASLAFLFRDKLSLQSLRELVGRRERAESLAGDAFTYETGSNQVFALAGNGLAVASSTGFQFLDEGGETLVKQVLSFQKPAVAASSSLIAYYDVGGTALRVVMPDGSCKVMDTHNPLLSATVSEDGYLAYTTEETGYKGAVYVCDPSLEDIFEWYSGAGYVLMARVTPDGKGLVTNCAQEGGSVLHFFSLDSEEERASWKAENELVLEFGFLADGSLAAVTENGLVFLDGSAREKGIYDFGDYYLKDYELNGSCAAVLLSKYLSGSGGILANIDSSGAKLGSLEIVRDPISLSASGNRLLVLYPDSLYLYSPEFEELAARGDIFNVKRALLRADSSVLLLSGYSAELLQLD